jgi:hypothetical protein
MKKGKLQKPYLLFQERKFDRNGSHRRGRTL